MSNYNSPMNLARKASAENGYAMAALLVALGVMAILMGAAMPTWSQMIRREKEEELIFRGTQYARAINQYQRKFANASPASLDVLIEQRLLRKKFKDPLSPNKDGEFQLLYLQNQSTMRGQGTGTGTAQSGSAGGGSIGPSPTARGAVVGVTSKNTGQSIRLYKGKNRYNEWHFLGMDFNTQAGPPAGAGGRGPQRGGPQRGGPPGGGRDGSGRQSGGWMNDPRNLPSRQGK
jgi:type II secretory pathway pseudopilin PulG